MQNIRSILFILTLGVWGVLGQVTVPCRKTAIQPVKDFNIEKFSGKEWYDIAFITSYMKMGLLEFTNETLDYRCPAVSIAETQDPVVYRVNFNMIDTYTDRPVFLSNLIHVNANDTAVSYLSLYKGNVMDIILDLDYKSWVFTYGCAIYDTKTYEFVTIKSRKRVLDKAIYDKLIAQAVTLGFSKDKIIVENQSYCY